MRPPFANWLRENGIRKRSREIEGLAQFNTTYGDMTVNAYLVWDPAAREAVAFDTGADCSEMLEPNRGGEAECETDSADARASGSRGGFAPAAKGDWCAGLHFRAGSARGRGSHRGRKTLSDWITQDRGAIDLGSFAGRDDLRGHRTLPSGRDCGRFALCRLDGRRERFLRGCPAKQSRENPDAAG